MKEKGQYQQGALNFQRPEAISAQRAPRRDQEVSPSVPVSRSASSRLDNDLWQEYRFEVENRQRLELPFVGLDEFQDMRDFSDGIDMSVDVAWPPVLTQPAYPRRTRAAKPDQEG